MCSLGASAPYCDEGNCRQGTFDYVARRFYEARTGTADSQLKGLHKAKEASHTQYIMESSWRQTGAHSVGDASTVLGGHVYFGTFDFDGSLQKYSNLVEFQEELRLGQHGGHYLSSAANLGSSQILLGTGGTPGQILTVETTPKLQFLANYSLPEDVGGIAGLATDGNSVLAIAGAAPARVLLLTVADGGQLSLESTLTLASDDEIAAPASPNFLDAANDLAYVATRKGCVYRISYSSGLLELAGWRSSCAFGVTGLFGLAVDSVTQKGVMISLNPYRQLVVFHLAACQPIHTLPLSKDMAYVTNLFVVSTVLGSSPQALIVGQSRRSIPAVMQVNLGDDDLASSWGIIAAGVCDEYSWTEDKRIVWVEGVEHRRYPARYYGCIWVPRGRIATGAVVSNGMLYVATERTRCTVCTVEEPLFGRNDGFCVEEHEEYRHPGAVCGQEAHNSRPLVWERALTESQLQRETNQLYGAVNMSIMSFQIGVIPRLGGMYAPKIKSAAFRGQPSSWLFLLLVVFISSLLPNGDATTKSFHQSEEGCNCLRNCEIFDMGDCGDDTEHNRRAFEEAWNKLPKGNDKLCDALKAMSFCSVRQAELTVGYEEFVMCNGIAKQIDCDVDCGTAARLGQRAFLFSALIVFAIIMFKVD